MTEQSDSKRWFEKETKGTHTNTRNTQIIEKYEGRRKSVTIQKKTITGIIIENVTEINSKILLYRTVPLFDGELVFKLN